MPNVISSHIKSRLGYAVFSGLKAVATSFARTLYVLWLQSTGLIFGVFTVLGGSHMLRLYRQHAWTGDPRRFWITLAFTVTCLGFTIVSFWKAKRRQRTSRAIMNRRS